VNEEMPQLSPESEIANRFHLVSRMADDLAHEIKNPLNSMVINLEVIRSRARKGDAAGVLDRADVLETEVRRLNGLIDGMLKLLRPERITSDEVHLDAVLFELVQLVGLQAKLARKDLNYTELGEAAVTRGRKDAIRFALLNLMAAELDAISGEDASLTVAGAVDPDAIRVTLETRSSASGDAHAAARESAIATARALLFNTGGIVDVNNGSEETGAARAVTVRFSRSRTA
jgi:signal transduction histidine kinase